uniref:Putative transcriptional regulator n=1 Tax=termite gut metagenome TaxID=433724 RepID=S0DDC6_9ZZZZ
MTIVQLEYLLAVVNHGSFSAAAEYCFVTQPTLSMQIANLEDELGVTLLDRNAKPIAPTEAGLAVVEQAKEAVAAFYGTKEKVSNLKGELSGKLRLGVLPTISPYLMPHFIIEFQKKCPNVELEIWDMLTSEIIEALEHDTIDIAIFSGGESPIKIRETDLFDDKFYVYVSPKHRFFGRKSMLLSEIDIKELLIISEGNCMRNQTFELCKEKKKVKSPYTFASCPLETLIHMVDATDSTMTVIPGMAVMYLPEERRKQVIPFEKFHAHRKITMAVGRTYIRESLISAVREAVLTAAEKFKLAEFLIP